MLCFASLVTNVELRCSMASSTFRGRRVVDPIPVQRGPLPRDGKYRSSFSDLAAAWENVGEVKSALQAAEARINEANAGLGSELEENEETDVPLQEVFSERQRYGRVARYELRPSRYGQAAPAANGFGEDQNNLRRVPDFPLNVNRPNEPPSRAPVHPPLLSPPSKDIHPRILNGRVSRNPPPSYPAYSADSEVRNPGVTTAYSSIYSANDPPGRRSPIRLHGNTLSTIPSASSFDDSLEVGGTSRLPRNESCSTSSLGLRPTIANSSDALARLKERIKQQKEQASRLSPTDIIQGNSSSNPPPGESTAVNSCRVDVDVPIRTAISKRKVASAPAAPAYKGFSEVESKTTVLSEMNRKVKTKNPTTHNVITNPTNQRPHKPQLKKGPPKIQRVIAPRRPTDVITTSSWRTGQQTVKKILGPAKKKTSPDVSRPQSSSSQSTDLSEPTSLNFQWKEAGDGKKGADDGDGSERGASPKDKVPRVISPAHEELVNGLKKDSGQAAELERDADEDVKDLKGNRMLSTEAKNILSDLDLDTDDESDKEIKKPVADSKPRQTRVNKPSMESKRKRPHNPQSQAAQMPSYPKQKVRHYDTDEVKKYMAKQIADRKKKLQEDRLLKEKAVKERKKKLEELYSRQRKNLQNNLNRKDKKLSFGETYSKGHSDFRSIIYPYNHPFPQDEVECYSEDAGVGESDKENLDIASFRGLPAYPPTQESNHHNISSSPSMSSEDHSISPASDRHGENDDRGQVPCVTTVSVGTKPVDARPSAYIGFLEEKSGEDVQMTRRELEPGSSSPTQPGAVSSTGNGELKPLSSPPREDRIAAIKQTAAQLKHRLETEVWRLGLNLPAAGLRKTDEQQPSMLTSASDYTVFKGALPGVGSLHEQAELNKELDTMTSAATRIQAAFRGHSVREGLNWKLPSGRTLRSTVRQGLHQRPGISGAGASESSQYSTAWDTVVPNEDKSNISDINTSYSSARSTVKSSTHSSGSLKDDRSSTTRSPSFYESEKRKQATGHLSKHSKNSKPLSSSLPWTSRGGDSLSVINIFTRRNPHLKLLSKEDEGAKEHDSEIASLLEETLQDDKAGETASLLDPPADLDQSKELLEQTLVEESPAKSKDRDYDDDFEGSSHGSKHEGSEKHTPSPDKKTDDPVYSETFESPEHRTSSPYREENLRSPNRSIRSVTLSPTLSEGELSHASEDVVRAPTWHSPPRHQGAQSSVPPYTPQAHPPPSVFMPAHQGGDRLSPGSLDMRLTAELNRLEYMEESVRQLTDVERTRAVSLAQQETVSLAQILKSKQLSHARDMENLRAKAREEALEAAKQLEEARRAAADAAAGAAETIARMRLEAATTISESADRLVKVQTEAARTTAESAKQVEEARSSAARTLLDVAKQQTADTRGVAAEAASAAAEAAVKTSMSRFYEQREQLLKEREARFKSYRDRSRDDWTRDRTRDSYSSYSASEHTDSYSRTRISRSGTDAVDRGSQAKGSPGTRTYASDEFSRGYERDKTASIHTASNLSVDRSVTRSQGTPTLSGSKHALPTGEESGSIPEEMEHSVADSVTSDVGLDVAEDDSLAEVLTGDSLKKPSERLERSPEAEDYTLNFEESVISSHTATDDEIDFRMILPSESHRRRSLGKTGRRGSIGSDQGTVSYSSDDNHDSQDFTVDKMLEDVSAAPFSGEDSFSQFTSDMVRLMKEEEVRAKHQAGLLRLREKALKEKTRAEMAWLECQKQRHRDKGADDVMPSIRKRQRGVLMRLQAEQAEIKRLKAANRAASCERRLLLMQQEDIARLRKNAKKIREKTASGQAALGQERKENLTAVGHDSSEHVKSEAESTEIVEEFEDKPADHSTRSHASEEIKTASPSAAHTTSIAEDLPSYQSPVVSRSESHPSNDSRSGPGSGERKRALSEGDSDEGSARDGTPSAAKGSPTASDSTVMQKLKKLKSQSGEKYLTLREQKLMKRRKEAENLLEDKKKLLEWEKRLDKEESLVRNLLNEALKLESSRNQGRKTSFTSEEEEHKDRSGRVSASPSVTRSPSSKSNDKDRSTPGTETISESIQTSGSRGHERSASESSVPEDIGVSAREKSRDSDKSRDSSIPEVYMKTQSHGTSIPEEIPEEYGNDTFESLDSTVTPAHSTPVRSDVSFKKDTPPSMSRRSSNDGSKSEEEASMTETSDHSDIESRVRRLRDQLELRKREVKRLYNERKKQRKAMLRAQEASLRQELQAVEMVISRTKAELNRPQTDSKRPETGSMEQQTINTKSDSSDTTPTPTPTRDVRYNLSRTLDASSSRKLTPTDKPVTVSASSEPTGVEVDISGRSSRSISDVPGLKEKEKKLSSIKDAKSSAKSQSSLDKNVDVDLTDRTRSPDEQFSANLRQSSESDHKKLVRVQEISEAEIEDEANTAEDLSISEESVVRTASKASYSEDMSRSSSKPISVSRGKLSDSDRKSSVKISDEAKTAEDLSLSEESEIATRTKSSRSESLPKKPNDDISEQSSLGGERKESEVSKSSRYSKSPLPEKSLSSKQGYSSSFESAQSEEDRTENDISEHISIEEDVRSGEAEESVKDDYSARERQLEIAATKDVERTKDISEVPEDVSSVKNKKSEIEEDLSSTGKTGSVSEDNRTASQKTEQSREKDFLKPNINEDQPLSYSADFEPSALDETDEGKSGSLGSQASYKPDFDASETSVLEDLDKSLQRQEKDEDLSGYLKEKEDSKISKGEKIPAQEDLMGPQVPSLALEPATDEESIAEELSENHEDEGEIADKEDSSAFLVKSDLQRIKREERPSLPAVPAKAAETPESKHSDEQTTDRIAQDLSATLLKESINCVTSVFEKRRRTAEDAPKSHDDVSNNIREEGKTSFKESTDAFRWSVEEERSEADIISLSEGEDSVSGLDFRSREQEGLIPRSKEDWVPSRVDQPREDQRVMRQTSGEQSDYMVNKLSDALLKEAASQMIAIMRAKRAKLSESQKEQNEDSPTPPDRTIEDESQSGEESPSSPRSSRFMAVQRFPDGISKYLEDTATPPGSPTDERRSSIDEKELADKLDQLRRLHEHLDGARETLVEDDNDRLEFTVHTNQLIEFPTEEEEDEEEITRRSRAASFLFSVPHHPHEVSPVVASSLSFFFERKRRGLPIDGGSPPSEIIGEDEADDDLEANSKRVYRRLVFDLSGSVLKELLSEEAPSNCPAWMKAKPRRKRRLHRGLQPLVHENDFLPVVEQHVLNLIGLGEARPSVDRVRRKTPLKAGKKDFVDAILIQELREDEPLWVDYDDDELAVKFQVADAIFESLLSETVMVLNAVQLRREGRAEVIGS